MTEQKSKLDIYQAITNKMIASLENGVVPWIKPWSASRGPMLMPCNAVSGRSYRGINILLLMAAAAEHAYGRDRWLTYNQAKKAGGNVRKGAKGTLIARYVPKTRQKLDKYGEPEFDEAGNPVEEHYAFMLGAKVFNVEQCDGLPDSIMNGATTPCEAVERDPILPIDEIEGFIAGSGANIRHEAGDNACYIPAQDRIVLPLREQFETSNGYYSVALHELGHWTGYKDRLDRDGVSRFDGFGTPRYAFEELIAQMSSAFLCAQFGIENLALDAGYIESWIRVLKNDKKAIVKASGKARTAAEYLNQLVEEKRPAKAVIPDVPAMPGSTDDTATPLVDDTPTPQTPKRRNPQVGGEDVELFGHIWPLRESVKLDSTVDRGLFRAQISRLKQLGYQFDPKTQTWHFADAAVATAA
ncbi:DUF3275 family protein [Carnimonas bestiolae]|uniref:DUF3275 family protein n=1 Tax=Carnimonas bestiolae TaxID=3402172 RepID=UPI003EDBBE3A